MTKVAWRKSAILTGRQLIDTLLPIQINMGDDGRNPGVGKQMEPVFLLDRHCQSLQARKLCEVASGSMLQLRAVDVQGFEVARGVLAKLFAHEPSGAQRAHIREAENCPLQFLRKP
jgi:hypothetical protein